MREQFKYDSKVLFLGITNRADRDQGWQTCDIYATVVMVDINNQQYYFYFSVWELIKAIDRLHTDKIGSINRLELVTKLEYLVVLVQDNIILFKDKETNAWVKKLIDPTANYQ